MKRRRSQRVEVACPHCAHTQWESGAAVSSFCRACGLHFEIARGRSVSKSARNARNGNGVHLRLASDDLWNGETLLNLAAARSREESARAAGNGSAPRTELPRNNGSPGPDSEAAREFHAVACFECGREHEVSAASTSTTCPACGAYVSLRSVHVRNDSRQKIKTRGDVTIHRNASLQGSSLFCRNLKVMGSVSGSIDCSGTASFYSDCEVRGVLSCRLLRVRRSVVIRFEHAVNAQDVEIAGDAFGHFYCSGHVTVEPGGSLRGEIIARTIEVADGASLQASLRVCSQETQSPALAPAAAGAPAEAAVAKEPIEEEHSFWMRRKISPAPA